MLNLDIIVDLDENQYQPLVIKHPIIRDYPRDWENKLLRFLKQEIPGQELPNVVNYVDCSFNPDYLRTHWREVYLGSAEKVFPGGRVWPPQPPRHRGGRGGVGFGRELSVRQKLTPRSERVWGVGEWGSGEKTADHW